MTNQYILVTGSTGVGKSSVCDYLHETFANSVSFSDPYIDNPFMGQAYHDKSFQSEIFFIKEFLKIHKTINTIECHLVIQERSIFECVHIFCRQFLYQSKINRDEYNLCVDLLNELSTELRMPDKIVYLTARPDVILNRIISRGRAFENVLDIDFVKLQQSFYDEWLHGFSQENNIPVIKIDSSDMDIQKVNEVVTQITIQ